MTSAARCAGLQNALMGCAASKSTCAMRCRRKTGLRISPASMPSSTASAARPSCRFHRCRACRRAGGFVQGLRTRRRTKGHPLQRAVSGTRSASCASRAARSGQAASRAALRSDRDDPLFLEPPAPSRVALKLAGPERLSVEDRPQNRTPFSNRAALFAMGDAGWLGWRPPIRSTALAEMRRGAIGDPAPWAAMTGIALSTLRSTGRGIRSHEREQSLALEPNRFDELLRVDVARAKHDVRLFPRGGGQVSKTATFCQHAVRS